MAAVGPDSREKGGYCSLASDLDYKLLHKLENPSQGETGVRWAWQLIELASPWHWEDTCIC